MKKITFRGIVLVCLGIFTVAGIVFDFLTTPVLVVIGFCIIALIANLNK